MSAKFLTKPAIPWSVVLPQKGVDAVKHDIDRIRIRQRRDSEMILVRRVEAAAGRHENVMLFQQLVGKTLVVQLSVKAFVQSNKRVHRTHWTLQVQVVARSHAFNDSLPGLI